MEFEVSAMELFMVSLSVISFIILSVFLIMKYVAAETKILIAVIMIVAFFMCFYLYFFKLTCNIHIIKSLIIMIWLRMFHLNFDNGIEFLLVFYK